MDLAKFDPITAQVAEYKAANEKLTFDIETDKGRRAARSHVHKLRGLKSVIATIHKTEKAEAKAICDALDKAKRDLTADVQGMIDHHLKPVEDKEAEIEAAKAAILTRLGLFGSAITMRCRDSVSAQTRLDDLKRIDVSNPAEWGEYHDRAINAKAEAIELAENVLANFLQAEASAAKAEAEAAARAEALRAEEARIAAEREAAERRAAAEREAIEAERAALQAERDAIEAEKQRAEREAAESARARQVELDAQHQAEREAAAKIEAEKQRAAEAERRAAEAEAQRAAAEEKRRADAEAAEIARREREQQRASCAAEIRRLISDVISDAGFSHPEDVACLIYSAIEGGRIPGLMLSID